MSRLYGRQGRQDRASHHFVCVVTRLHVCQEARQRFDTVHLPEALGLSCVAVLHTSFLEARLPSSLPETLAEIRHEPASGRLDSVQITDTVAGIW
jgi:hypothetical protein